MPRIRAGELATRITIEERVGASDGQGGQTYTWGGTGHSWSAWSRKRYLGGGDASEVDQSLSRRRVEYTIRRRTDVTVTSAMRVKDGSLVLAIQAVAADDQDHSSQVLVCEEVPV